MLAPFSQIALTPLSRYPRPLNRRRCCCSALDCSGWHWLGNFLGRDDRCSANFSMETAELHPRANRRNELETCRNPLRRVCSSWEPVVCCSIGVAEKGRQ